MPPINTAIPGRSKYASLPSGVIISPLSRIIENLSGTVLYTCVKPSIIPPPGVTYVKAIPVINIPPSTSIITCTTSVQATADRPPQTEYVNANKLNPIILIVIKLPSPLPNIVSIALPPKYITVVRLTKTNRLIQNTARIVFKFLLYLFLTNSGIV